MTMRQATARTLYSVMHDNGVRRHQRNAMRCSLERQGYVWQNPDGTWAITDEGRLVLESADVQPLIADLKRRDMKLQAYLWPNTLKRYSTGQVFVIAASVEDAWARIKKADPQAWICLRTGGGYHSLMDNETDAELDAIVAEVLKDNFTDYGRPIPAAPTPMVFALDKAPVVIAWGSE